MLSGAPKNSSGRLGERKDRVGTSFLEIRLGRVGTHFLRRF